MKKCQAVLCDVKIVIKLMVARERSEGDEFF